jgi:hypothetical protein
MRRSFRTKSRPDPLPRETSPCRGWMMRAAGPLGGKDLSARTRTAGVAIGVVLYLYLGWLGWKDILVAPAPQSEPAAIVAASMGADAVVDAAPAPVPAPPAPVPSTEASSPTASAADAGVTHAAAPVASPSESPRPLAASLEPGVPRDHPSERRLPDAPSGSADPPMEDPEASPDQPQSRLGLGGWVLDREGNAVAGLPVEARPRRLFASLDAGSAAVPADLRGATDGAGRFAFEPVPDGEYDVRTGETDRYEKAMAALRAGVDSAVLVVETKTGRTLHVHGVLECARGGPLKGVRV